MAAEKKKEAAEKPAKKAPAKKAEKKEATSTGSVQASAKEGLTRRERKKKIREAKKTQRLSTPQSHSSLMRVSPRKLRLLANLARGKDVQVAIEAIRYSNKKLSADVVKLIRGAVANASAKRGVDPDKLFVERIVVEQGPVLKRFMTRARGSGARILKRTSYMSVLLGQRQEAKE